MPCAINTRPNKHGTTVPKFTLPTAIKMAQSTITELPITTNITRANRMDFLEVFIRLFKGNIFTVFSMMLLIWTL